MQARAKRRPTLHCKEKCFEYLDFQSLRENAWTSKLENKQRVIYMDGVFDLFHAGHLEAIQQARNLGDKLILGVSGDVDATGYKREPIINQTDRCEILGERAKRGERNLKDASLRSSWFSV